jgi:hypothetical protein
MRLKLILIIGAIAIFVVGCGGGGDSTSGGTTSGGSTSEGTTAEGDGNATTANGEANGDPKPLSKPEFKNRINEICIQVPPTYEEELKKAEKGGKKLSPAEKTLKAAVPPIYAAVEQMESVKPPPGEEKKLEEVIDAMEAAAKGLEAEPKSKLSGPGSPFAEFQALTKKYGFETCSGL